MKLFVHFAVVLTLAISIQRASADVRMPRIFSDHMVLQRDAEVVVWGWADPRERVRVSIASQEHSTRADRQGNWSVKLQPMKAGGPHTMTISGKNRIELSDVLMGEVWLGSGQSNMQWSVAQSANPEEEIQMANHPEIRLFTVPRRIATSPLNDLEGGEWQVCSPESISSFSAVAYYFGRHLHSEIGVPVGLIHSSWGGTVAETWISEEMMRKQEDFREKLEAAAGLDLDKLQAEARKRVEEWNLVIEREDAGMVNGWYRPDIDDAGWNTMTLPVLWEQAGLPGLAGVVWFRKTITLDAARARQEIILNLGPVDDSDYTYINGHLIGKTLDQYNQNRRYVVSPDLLREGENLIAVRVIDTGGGGGIWGDPSQLYYLAGNERVSLAGNWRYNVGVEADAPPSVQGMAGPNSFPSLLFNGMIHPILPYTIKGAIWYQGESNAGRAYQYRTLFPGLIEDWRKQWNHPTMPFLFVQLANFRAPSFMPSNSDWAELREAQSMALSLPYTGMAVTIDIGEADDIHPKNKQDVGLRLALNALKIAYGKDIVHSGPVYESMSVENSRVRLRFREVGSGLMIMDKYGYLKGFAIAGPDRVFHWARAFLDGNDVVVYSDKVENPLAVRYAWGDNPDDANLYNREGLPASPFRTDYWPGITEGKR